MTNEAETKRGDVELHRELAALIGDRAASPAAIAKLLDGLDSPRRARVVRRLGRREQRDLYAKVADFARVGLCDLVSPARGDLEEVRHLGRNTLPAFTIFEKRFCRPPGASAAAPEFLAGYNFQKMSPLTGPGYFLAVEDPDRPEVLVDYHRLPEATPPDWPPVRSNESGLARFVYGFMVDRLRRVSEHVTVGSAARNGRELGSYFVLSRAD